MKTFAYTHIGLVRKNNEDRYLVKEIENGSVLLAVADGMGGEAGGHIAAETTINCLSKIETGSEDLSQSLEDFVLEANRSVIDKSAADCSLEGMGTTLICAFIQNKTAYWAHVGDSRLYLIRNNEVVQVTCDQNMAQFLVEEGEISLEESRDHPSQNQLDQCVGCESCEPETGVLALEQGDLVVLSTDGLHCEMDTETFRNILVSEDNIQSKAEALLDTALKAGGKDNMTVVICAID